MSHPPSSLSYFATSAILAMMNTISTRESPLPTCQLLFCLKDCSITFPIRRILPPPRRSEITNVVSAGTNTMVMPLITPGILSGKITLQKVCTGFAPRSLCRVDNIAVDLDQYVIDRKHHERQEVVHHTEDDGIRCIDDLQVRQMQKTQHAVDDTVFFQEVSAMPGCGEENSSTLAG